MKTVLMIAAALPFALGLAVMPEPSNAQPVIVDQAIAHGGGCRKSSPPGQCCHMDRKAGTVHCH
ncbi:hypothetical protein [Thalassospira sp. UBA1131]|uniref:hypothetical protein n=1 Tax=Thalassospira sp. UBA1131 TaxID=1947672 RepID=UPI0025FE79FF|nr:hypothetical protein [Thalassospira sp. UBA1131]